MLLARQTQHALAIDQRAVIAAQHERVRVGHQLRRVRDSGVTIVLIDHDMHLVLNLCDTIYVLDFGKVIAHGPPASIKSDRRVAAAYLGSTHAETVPA